MPIDKALVPLVAGVLKQFEQRSYWNTEVDYERGYNAFAELQVCMSGNCISDLTASIDRLYRLLDTTYNGTIYSAGDPDPATGERQITPDIPAVPPAGTSAENAMRAHVGRLWQLAENATNGRTFQADAGIEGSPALDDTLSTRATIRALQGIINAGWFGIGGQPATLADMINSVRLGSQNDQERVFTALDAIVGASSGLNIFDTVRSLFTDSADLGLEGGQIAVQLVSSLGVLMALQLQSSQLERVLQTMGGAGLFPPEDNILQALRGTAPATEERNITSLLE